MPKKTRVQYQYQIVSPLYLKKPNEWDRFGREGWKLVLQKKNDDFVFMREK